MNIDDQIELLRHKIKMANQSRRRHSGDVHWELVIRSLRSGLSRLYRERTNQSIVLYIGGIPVYATDIARFRSNLIVNATGCLIWNGYVAKRGNGYGEIKIGTVSIRVHRLAWLLAGRDIPVDKPYVLHDCPGGDNRLCCNVAHLWVGTYQDNNRDKANKNRGHKSAVGLPFGVKRKRSRFEANVRVDGILHYLGRYSTAQEAHEVALAAKRKLRS